MKKYIIEITNINGGSKLYFSRDSVRVKNKVNATIMTYEECEKEIIKIKTIGKSQLDVVCKIIEV